MRAVQAFKGSRKGDLQLVPGQLVLLKDVDDQGMGLGRLEHGAEDGWFPLISATVMVDQPATPTVSFQTRLLPAPPLLLSMWLVPAVFGPASP